MKISDIIANTLMNDKPVLNDKIHILLTSKLYLQIFSFLYLIFSSFQLNSNIIKKFF